MGALLQLNSICVFVFVSRRWTTNHFTSIFPMFKLVLAAIAAVTAQATFNANPTALPPTQGDFLFQSCLGKATNISTWCIPSNINNLLSVATPDPNLNITVSGSSSSLVAGTVINTTVTGSASPAFETEASQIVTINTELQVINNPSLSSSSSAPISDLLGNNTVSSLLQQYLSILPYQSDQNGLDISIVQGAGGDIDFTVIYPVTVPNAVGSYYAAVSGVDVNGNEILCYESYFTVVPAARRLR